MPKFRETQERRQAIFDTIEQIDELTVDGIMSLLGIGPTGRSTIQRDLIVLEEAGYIEADKPKKYKNRKWCLTELGKTTRTIPLGLDSQKVRDENNNTPMERVIALASKIRGLEEEIAKYKTELKEILL